MTHPAYQVDWNLSRTFTAVVACGSMTSAARDLGLTYPTVARHIQQLEESLRLTLFDRTSTGMSVNAAGIQLSNSATDMRDHAGAFGARSESIRTQPSGTVRITASALLSQLMPELLLPLRDWAQGNGATIEFVPSETQLNLLEHDVDIALRHVRPTQVDLICRKVASVKLGLWGNRSYLAGFEPAADTLAPNMLYIDGIDARYLQRAAAKLGIDLAEERFVLRTDCFWSQLQAARSGWGVAALPNYLAKQYPELVPYLPELAAPSLDIWVVARRDMRDNKLHRRFFDHLADSLCSQLE